jgi:phosphoenolpyruvate-protein phosphotransferase
MSQRVLRGLAASSGVALGSALVVRDLEPSFNGGGGAEEQARALAALDGVARELGRLAELARKAGRAEEAEILESNRLMAEDPALHAEVEALAADAPAPTAVLNATERHASLLAGLEDAYLAARAADVRQLGRRAARILTGASAVSRPNEPSILIARDLGPADVAELELADGKILGIALAEGAATSHVAIMARSFGLPMVVGLGDGVVQAADDERVVLDGDNGVVVLAPTSAVHEAAARAVENRRLERQRLIAQRGLPCVTKDARAIRLLCNAVTPAEVAAGLEAGAKGVGLLRTEFAFLEARSWPTEAEHLAALEAPLAALARRVATVRTLDFGADKTPPFLAGVEERGLRLALAYPEAFSAQLRAILRAGHDTQLRVLLPLVESAEQLSSARVLLDEAIEAVAWSGPPPQLGAMIETPEAAVRAGEIAAAADFLSIGTNDLVQYTLGLDRELPLATAQAAADPLVLASIARIVAAAHGERLAVEVCGEAAGETELAVLLLGLGVDELSVAPARVDRIRALVRAIRADEAAAVAQAALSAGSAEAAVALAGELARSGEGDDSLREAGDGLGSILA